MSSKNAGTYVRVLYDYEYQDSDSKKVSIKEGEEWLLLKKVSDDWWHVCREKELIYVPANYVEQIPKTVSTQEEKDILCKQDLLDQVISGDEDDILQNGDNGDKLDGQAIPKPTQDLSDLYAEPHYENLESIQTAMHNKLQVQLEVISVLN